MKKLILLLAILIAGLGTTEIKAGNGNVNFNFFYHNLSSYGEWIEIDYDVIVWKPYNIGHSWSPYSVGNWEYTSYGWYWNSFEPFGWATYHYGRWYYDDYYQWVWIPGYEWGPSWVEWRYSDNYIGWSPLPPYAEYRFGVGIYFANSYRTSYHHWNFVNYNRFCHRNVYMHFVDYSHKNRIFNNTKYRTNYYADRGRIINGGLDRNLIERRSGSKVVQREIQNTTDLRDYTGSRGNVNSDRIIAYQPGERDIQKYRNVEVNKVNKADAKSSLKRESVTFRNEEQNTREILRREQAEQKPEVKRNEAPINIEKRNSVETNRPVIIENRTPAEVKRTQPVQQKEVSRTETYRMPEAKKPEVRRVETPTQPVRKENKSYRAPENNSSKNSPVIKRNQTPSQSRSVSRPVSSQREVSKSTKQNSTTRKKKD